MITTDDGYSCYQDVRRNQIIIGLPQTTNTLTNTITAISSRKEFLSPEEESVLIVVARALFEKYGNVGAVEVVWKEEASNESL